MIRSFGLSASLRCLVRLSASSSYEKADRVSSGRLIGSSLPCRFESVNLLANASLASRGALTVVGADTENSFLPLQDVIMSVYQLLLALGQLHLGSISHRVAVLVAIHPRHETAADQSEYDGIEDDDNDKY